MRPFRDFLARRHVGPHASDPLYHSVLAAINEIPVDFGGGCPPKKAYALAWLIRAQRVTASLDIGVYRGRSLVPQALAHRDHTGGTAFGIDPFSNGEAMQHDNPALAERLRDFAVSTDSERIYADLLILLDRLTLQSHCRLIRATSSEAAKTFTAQGQRFGLIHADGNHDEARVMEDVMLYLPLVEDGGLIVIDDISWTSVKPAVEFVASGATLLFHESAPSVTELDYAVFQRGGSERRSRFLRESLRILRGT